MNAQETLLAALEAQRLSPQTGDDAISVHVGAGPRRRKADISLRDALGALPADADEAALRQEATALARGVRAHLGEPARSRGEEMEFGEAAAVLLPSIEREAFFAGVRLAGGEESARQPFNNELHVAFYIELDQGLRLLPVSQAERWGAHPERLFKAALSVLFHRSGFGEAVALEESPDVERWALGDGFDPARALLLDFMDYPRCRKGVLFAFPSHDELLVRDAAGDAEAEAFARLAQARCAAAEEPLSAAVYGYRDGRRVPEALHPVGT